MSQEIWHTAIAEGAVPLHGVDADDGFVHLSTAEQLHETLRVHFNGQNNLVVLAFDVGDLGVGLRCARGAEVSPLLRGFGYQTGAREIRCFSRWRRFRIVAGADKKDWVNGHIHNIAATIVSPATRNRP